jgi:hypothetical protein
LKAVASGVVPDRYWIDDKDFASKRLFLFMFLYTLFETGDKQGAPVITVAVA